MTPTRRPVRRRLPARRQTLTTSQKGYGHQHQQLRAKVKRSVDTGTARCWRCGELIHPLEKWDLGHRDDVVGAKVCGIYAGPEHRHCSAVSGGWKRQGRIGMPPRRPQPPAKALEFFRTGTKTIAAQAVLRRV